jgi:hypothetical protein
MEENLPQKQTTSVQMQITEDVLNPLATDSEGLSKETEEALKQTAMRTIIYQISANYREELEELLGKDNIDENGQPLALQEATIPQELYEFICKNVIGMIPTIEIEIVEEANQESEEASNEEENEDHSGDSFEEE